MLLPVSVIVPCHNYGHHLRECLESILAQTVKPAEVVVVDDDSSDNTPAVAAAFAGRGVRYLRVAVRNPHDARKAGFHATTAPFCCSVDADDRLAPEYLESGLRTFTDPSIVVAFSPVQEFGERHNTWDPQPLDIRKENYVHAGAIFRRSAAIDANAWRPCSAIKEDHEFWIRILCWAGHRAARNPVPYWYRIHSGSRRTLIPPQLTRWVVGAHLVGGLDPQRGPALAPWDLVLPPWVATASANGLRPVLLYNELPSVALPVLEKLGCTAIRVKPCPPHLQNSTYRWQLYADWLARENAPTAFFTDVWDVHFNDDPFALLRTDFDLWFGRETAVIGDRSAPDRWLALRCALTTGGLPRNAIGRPLLNCGIIGGFRGPLLNLFHGMLKLLRPGGCVPLRSSDMAAFNAWVYSQPDLSRYWTRGAPLHSVFKAYERNAPVAIIHK